MKKSELVDEKIAKLTDWLGKMCSQLRDLIFEVDPEIFEEWKWKTPTYTKNGNVCSIGVFKDHIKLNFFKGAEFSDVNDLFNAGLDSKSSRGIDFTKNDQIDKEKVMNLVHVAIKHDLQSK